MAPDGADVEAARIEERMDDGFELGPATQGLDGIEEVGTELLHLQAIVPRLYIGDYHASQSEEILAEHSIRYVVSAMKQTYPPRAGTEILNVPVDDTDRTNIIGN